MYRPLITDRLEAVSLLLGFFVIGFLIGLAF